MREKSIEQLRDEYYSAISSLNNEQDILNTLPNPDFISFFKLMNGLIDKLNNEIIDLQNELEKETESDMIEYIKEEILLCKFKIEICQKKVELALYDVQIEEEAVNQKKHLIFAFTDMGNVYFESDMKDIPIEYYDSVLECLNLLESGIEESNGEKAKALTGNAKLSGIHEAKKFKIRVYYQILAPDCVFVILVRQKKDDNSKEDREAPITRKSQVHNQYEMLRKALKDPIKKQEIISKHEDIRTRIFDKIEKRKK